MKKYSSKSVVRKPINRNPSNKSPQQLAEIFFREILEKGVNDAEALFDADIRIDFILPLPQCVNFERPSDNLQDLIETGDLDELFDEEINHTEQLMRKTGFIVTGSSQIWDFSRTVFNSDGNMLNGCVNGVGRHIILGFGETLEAAYNALVQKAVTRVAECIRRALYPPKQQVKSIDEFCGTAPGSFKKLVAQKKDFIKKMEQNKKDRVHDSRSARAIGKSDARST